MHTPIAVITRCKTDSSRCTALDPPAFYSIKSVEEKDNLSELIHIYIFKGDIGCPYSTSWYDSLLA